MAGRRSRGGRGAQRGAPDGRPGAPTVASACQAYVRSLRAEGRLSTAHDAHLRFRRVVYGDAADGEFTPTAQASESRRSSEQTPAGEVSPWRPLAKTYRERVPAHPIAALPLARLTTPALRDWHVGLTAKGLSSASANRTLVALKAALNLAVRDRTVAAAVAQEWRELRLLKHAVHRRDLFLDVAQRRALLRQAAPPLRELLEAALYTGCRAGELTSALCAAFDPRTRMLTVTGKTGTRTMPLAPAAVELFVRLTQDRAASDRLLVRANGTPWAHSDWDELIREAAARAGLPRLTCLYTLRHSFITQALLDGMSTLEVARLVGTSLEMIDKHYGHLVFSAAQARLAKVNFL